MRPEAGSREARTTGGPRLAHMPGLDGLRALAVIAVLLYHAELAWIPGGFLGVEVFFVISGYLITALLLAEWRRRGCVDLKAFWLRRARRLLPALYLTVVVTLAFAVVFLPGEVAGLRSDAIAAFGYVTNWYLVFGHESYFEAVGRPSLLKHLWSLAVEEQFYVLWPLLFTAGISFGALRWRQRRMLLATLVGAGSSALMMAILYVPDVDPSRIYYGTDTRASGLLIGAALAFVWFPGRGPTEVGMDTSTAGGLRLPSGGQRGRLRHWWGWMAPLLLDVAGIAALGGLVWFCLRLGEFQPFLYRGGFALVGLATAVVIMATTEPYTRLGAVVLAWGPLRWIGVRSYGIYLWHWPVFMVTRPQLDVPFDALPLLALRLAVTIVIADLSYRYVETPIRTGALERAWKRLRSAQGFHRWDLVVRWAGAIVPVLAFCVVLSIAVAQAKPPDPPSYLSSTEAIHTESPDNGAADAKTPDAPAPSLANAKRAPSAEPKASSNAQTNARQSADKPSPTDEATAGVPVGPVSAIGDSVMLGGAQQLRRSIDNLTVMDAEVGMQVSTAIDILRYRRDTGQLGKVVVVHLGSNGTFTAEQFDEMMQVLEGVPRVVFVNVKVPRIWEQPNNEVLADGVRRYPDQAVLVDWYSATVNRPELFAPDGIHPELAGRRIYANLIAEAIEAS
jgi:peptidoglycan/LPS O-acetylase OafA/YrhL